MKTDEDQREDVLVKHFVMGGDTVSGDQKDKEEQKEKKKRENLGRDSI